VNFLRKMLVSNIQSKIIIGRLSEIGLKHPIEIFSSTVTCSQQVIKPNDLPSMKDNNLRKNWHLFLQLFLLILPTTCNSIKSNDLKTN